MDNNQHTLFISADSKHIQRERNKAKDLRKTTWWKQQLGVGECYYCQGKFSSEHLTMDHKVPIVRGGLTTKKNVVVCCKDCNSKKKYFCDHESYLWNDQKSQD